MEKLLPLPGLWQNICQHIMTTRAKDETRLLRKLLHKMKWRHLFQLGEHKLPLKWTIFYLVCFLQVNEWPDRLVFQYVANNYKHQGPLNHIFTVCISAQKSMRRVRLPLIFLQVAANLLQNRFFTKIFLVSLLSKAALYSSGMSTCVKYLLHRLQLSSVCKRGL